MAAVFLALSLYFEALRPDMLLATHFGGQTQNQSFFVRESSTFLPNFVVQHAAYLIVATIGVIWAIRRRDLDILFPLTWFAFTWLALMIQRPLWYHHVMLLTLPLAWLCAFGIEVWVRGFQRSGRRQSVDSFGLAARRVARRIRRGAGCGRPLSARSVRGAPGRADVDQPAQLHRTGLPASARRCRRSARLRLHRPSLLRLRGRSARAAAHRRAQPQDHGDRRDHRRGAAGCAGGVCAALCAAGTIPQRVQRRVYCHCSISATTSSTTRSSRRGTIASNRRR